MTRFVVAIEGAPMADGRLIDHRALRSRDERRGIPVLFEGRWDMVVGCATDFQRNEDGEISFEIEWNDRGFTMNCETFYKHITVGQCLWDVADGVHFLATGVVLYISVNDSPTPWDVLNNSGQNRS